MSMTSKIRIVNATAINLQVVSVNLNEKRWDSKKTPKKLVGQTIAKDGGIVKITVVDENVIPKLSKEAYTITLANPDNANDAKLYLPTIVQYDCNDRYTAAGLTSTKTDVARYCYAIVSTPYSAAVGTDDNIPVMNIYIYPPRAALNDAENSKLTFYAFSDPQFVAGIKGSYCDHGSQVQVQYRLRDSMMAKPDFWKADYVFIPGDLTAAAKTFEPDLFRDDFPDEWLKFKDYFPVVCEGYGNHDMENNFGQGGDLSELVQERNNLRKNILGNLGFTTNHIGVGNLHYKWKIERRYGENLSKTRSVHFFMLNLLPTKDCSKNREHNSNYALDFLIDELKSVDKDDIIFLFHHYGWYLPDPDDPERWWTQEQREEYLDCLVGYTVGGIFYGHEHHTRYNHFANENHDYDGAKKRGVTATCVGGGNSGIYTKVTVELLDPETDEGKNCLKVTRLSTQALSDGSDKKYLYESEYPVSLHNVKER